MAIPERLLHLLKTNRVGYQTQKHQTAYTAQEIAAASHVPGRQLAKCVLVKSNVGLALAVLPAVVRVDFGKLKALLKAKKIGLATEADVKQAFPDVEVGAMPPFGILYGVPTYVETALTACQEIICNGGSHTETISLPYRDFARLGRPIVGSFGMPVPGQAPTKKQKAAKAKKAARSKKKKSITRTKSSGKHTRSTGARAKRSRPKSRR